MALKLYCYYAAPGQGAGFFRILNEFSPIRIKCADEDYIWPLIFMISVRALRIATMIGQNGVLQHVGSFRCKRLGLLSGG